MAEWNLWHGCHKCSPGCAHCYVYRTDAKYGRDASLVQKTGDFSLPLRHDRQGNYKIPSGETVWTCFTSDFLVEDADEWRAQAWDMIRRRPDLHFIFITKRIERFVSCIPHDWGDGWSHVSVGCTCENQDRADARLPLFLKAPLQHRFLACEPLLEPLSLEPYLRGGAIEQVVVGGESGAQARECRYEWVLALRAQCMRTQTAFTFKQTGANFVKEGRRYAIERRFQHRQAAKAGVNWTPERAQQEEKGEELEK